MDLNLIVQILCMEILSCMAAIYSRGTDLVYEDFALVARLVRLFITTEQRFNFWAKIFRECT